MTAAALLQSLRDRGVSLIANGDSLDYDAPEGVLTPQVMAAMQDAKPQLLAILKTESRGGTTSGIGEQYVVPLREAQSRQRPQLVRHGDDLWFEEPDALREAHVQGELEMRLPELWNAARADELISAAYQQIGREVPDGAVLWADQNRPELMAVADAAEVTIQVAAEMQDSAAFHQALANFATAHQEIASAFTQREPKARTLVMLPMPQEW